MSKNAAFQKPVVKNPPNASYILWCPFCDDWYMRDTMISRKRLGQHISDEHPEEVRYPRGVTPPEIVDIKEIS